MEKDISSSSASLFKVEEEGWGSREESEADLIQRVDRSKLSICSGEMRAIWGNGERK